MIVNIKPSKLKGRIRAPYSKSLAHRMLICAALAKGESCIEGIAKSEDMLATLDCIEGLGALYRLEGDIAYIKGTGEVKKEASFDYVVFPCRESGSTLRFLIPLAMICRGKVRFKGQERLFKRGISVYEDIFTQNGNDIELKKYEDHIDISGSLKAGSYTLRGDVSSQFISGLMFALPLLESDSMIRVTEPVESRSYIDITLEVLKLFGVDIEEREKNLFYIKGASVYKAYKGKVEGDWSNAAFLYAFNSFGNAIEPEGLNDNSKQGDRVCRQLLLKGEGLKDLTKLKAKGREEDLSQAVDISDCPDLGPVLFAAYAGMHGGRFIGTRRLKIKESDRALAMKEELEKFGIEMDIFENSVNIYKGELKEPCEHLMGHNDHRIVMALSILCSLTGGVIEGAEAVRKSYPDFFKDMKDLGLEVEIEV
ncbi:MAG: 3-phosphoshikimate 1-carboxyvinyltransferase [Lachnospiraceae bacterium]|nr:3-phosphoshikimate 1-carboxyvinyltransferase [Lachnospiraceae bacterium]